MKQKIFRLLALMLVVLLVIGQLSLITFAQDDDSSAIPTFEQADNETTPSESPPEESSESDDPTEKPFEEPSESVNPAEGASESANPADEPSVEPSEELSESAGLTVPAEPVDADAEVVKPPADTLSPEEPTEPQPAADLNKEYHVGQDVTVYEWCDANLWLEDGKHNTSFPYITDYGFNMNPSETEFTSSSKYGQLFYCIDWAAAAGNAGTVTTTNGTDLLKTDAWTRLSWDTQNGITFALLYGSPNCSSYYDNIYGYAATQLIIWEYQLGKRTTASDTVTFFNATLNQSDRLKEAYNSILSSICKHEKAPSFSGQTFVLKGYGVANGVTITDSNGLFANDAWKIAEAQGFAATQSGNSLTVYAPENGGAEAGQTTTLRLTRNIKTSTGVALCAKTSDQTCITGSPPDPLNVTIRVRLEAAQLDIIKLTPDGKNVAGIEFEVYRGYDAVQSGTPMHVGKTVAGTYQGKPCGRLQIENLTPGNYYVHEIIPAGYTDRPVTSSQNAEGSGSGAGWYYVAVTAANTKDNPAIVIYENQPITAQLDIIKLTPDGKNVAGVEFEVYRGYDAVQSGTPTYVGKTVAGTYQGKPCGRIQIENLTPGNYYVHEIIPAGYTDRPVTSSQNAEGSGSGAGWYYVAVTAANTKDNPAIVIFENRLLPGTAKLQKTSSTGDVEGFCFKLYRHVSKETWYGRSDENGGIYLTNSGYEASERVYEFSGLTDGTYTVLEALSQSDQHLKTTSFTLTVYDKNGNQTSSKTYAEGDFTFDSNGDARLAQVEIAGLNGGGRLEIAVNNEPVLGAVTIDKTDEAGRPLKGATFQLEYFDGDEWIPVRPSQSAGVGLCSSKGLTAKGELTTGEDGTVVFEGLMLYDYDEAIAYRVTETQAPPHYQLLAEPVFEDVIQPDANGVYHAYVNVINTPVFSLPPAGEGGFGPLPLAVLGMGLCAAAIVLLKKKQCN